MTAQNTQETRSGSYLIPNLILLAIIVGVVGYVGVNIKKHKDQTQPKEEVQKQVANPQTQAQASAEVQKTDKPTVDLFVMSFCPYGNRAENTVKPVKDLLGDKVNWNVHYIVSPQGNNFRSLHGPKEVDQDLRELCVNKLYDANTHWDFMLYVNENCGSDGSCWKDAANATGVAPKEIETCMQENGKELLGAEAKATQEKQVRGSPTLFINGVESKIIYRYENPEAIKNAICSAFENAPEECETVLEAQGSQAPSGRCN